MPSLRPKVRIVQQYDEPSITALIPDLESTIIGPAYTLQDDVSPDTKIGEYGKSMAFSGADGLPLNLPGEDDVAITASGPGSTQIDYSSVVIHLRDVWLQIENAYGADGVVIEGENTLTSLLIDFDALGVVAGDRVVFNSGDSSWGNEPQAKVVQSAESGVPNVLTMTTNVDTESTSPTLSTVRFRVERYVAEAIIPWSHLRFEGNQVIIDGGLELDGLVVNFAQAFMTYRALRLDLNELITIERVADIPSLIGPIDERNPLAVGAFVALQNTSTHVKVFGINKDDVNGAGDRAVAYTEAAEYLENREDVYALTPLTSDSSIIQGLLNHAIQMSDPDKSRFRIVLGSGVLPLEKTIFGPSTGEGMQCEDLVDGLDADVLVDAAATFITDSVQVGHELDITLATTTTTHTVTAVFSEIALMFSPPLPNASRGAHTGTGNGWDVTDLSGIEGGGSGETFNLRGCFSRLNDNNATFQTSGVRVGDFVALPDPTWDDGVELYEVTHVYSENRLRISPLGPNGEFPGNTAELLPDDSIDYKILRNLTKQEQIEELSALAQGMSHHRLSLVWPDEILLSGVINGLLGQRTWQPGYYLACALSGQVAGFPPHQNFTGLAVAGIDELRRSSEYFSDSQLDALMAGGWNVYTQANKATPPESLRTLTTDVSFLELMELMIVKNFDFVSLFYRDLLRNFLKGYNVLPETIDLIAASFFSGTRKLQSRVIHKIGSPILGASLVDIRVKEGAADHVELVATVDLPRPLNTLTLFLTI